jgi:hypothetical protein
VDVYYALQQQLASVLASREAAVAAAAAESERLQAARHEGVLEDYRCRLDTARETEEQLRAQMRDALARADAAEASANAAAALTRAVSTSPARPSGGAHQCSAAAGALPTANDISSSAVEVTHTAVPAGIGRIPSGPHEVLVSVSGASSIETMPPTAVVASTTHPPNPVGQEQDAVFLSDELAKAHAVIAFYEAERNRFSLKMNAAADEIDRLVVARDAAVARARQLEGEQHAERQTVQMFDPHQQHSGEPFQGRPQLEHHSSIAPGLYHSGFTNDSRSPVYPPRNFGFEQHAPAFMTMSTTPRTAGQAPHSAGGVGPMSPTAAARIVERLMAQRGLASQKG